MNGGSVTKEYKRLKELFVGSDETKRSLVDELLKKAAFLKVELEELQVDISKNGVLSVTTKGVTCLSPTYKAYLQTISVYQGIIKTLNTIFGKQIEEPDDEFETFMTKTEKR